LVIVERAYYETTICIYSILIVDELLTIVLFSQMLIFECVITLPLEISLRYMTMLDNLDLSQL